MVIATMMKNAKPLTWVLHTCQCVDVKTGPTETRIRIHAVRVRFFKQNA